MNRTSEPGRGVWARLLGSALFLASVVATGWPAPAAADGIRPVLAMYYAWFDNNSWRSGQLPDQPATPYVSSDRATIERQVGQAQQAGIDAFELNWWGPNNPTDTNLQTLLSVANGHNFKATICFDLNSPFQHNAGDVATFLTYAKHYESDPSWFQFKGRPVVVFYGVRKYDVGTWATIRAQADPGNHALWIGEGDDFNYLSVFDGIYPYSIAWSPDPAGQLASYAGRTRAVPGKLWMATTMPGYDDTHLGRSNGFAVNRQNGAYYTSVWQGAIATNPDLVSITTFNEWPEGSMIEPSVSYGNLYLQLTKQLSDAYRATGASSAPTRPGAECFSQAGQGRGSFCVADDSSAAFDTSFQTLGGVNALGYPASQRFVRDGFLIQVTQGAALQWRPDQGTSVLANTFEWLSDAGQDDWLLANAGIPLPIRNDGSNGNFQLAKQTRLGWLTDPAITAAFVAAGSTDRAIELYGLPMSAPERHGPFIVQRFQRIAFQHWVQSVAGMPTPGSVVRVLAGDYLKQLGIVPAAAAIPPS